MQPRTINIKNGVELFYIPQEKFKTISLALLIRTPLKKETATKTAIIPQLLKRGSAKYTSLSEINVMTEQLYGSIFDASIVKKGEEQILQFFLETLDSRFDASLHVNNPENEMKHEENPHDESIYNESIKDDAIFYKGLELLCEIVFNPLINDDGFNDDFVSGEKENLKNRINARKNDKKEYAKLRCLEEMCKNEPFGVYGDGYIDDVDEITPQNLYSHYKSLISEYPMDFIVIGNCDPEKTAAKIKELISGIERHNIVELPKPQPNYNPSKEKYINESADIIQSKLCMGLRTNAPNKGEAFFNMLVMNEIFGGNPESKLFKNVREKESLCYYVNSFVYTFKSIIFIQSGVDKENTERAINLIKEQMNELKHNISDDEIEKAKKSLTKKLTSVHDDPQAVMDFYLSQKMLEDNKTIEEVVEMISNVKKEDIFNAANEIYIDTIYLLEAGEEQEGL